MWFNKFLSSFQIEGLILKCIVFSLILGTLAAALVILFFPLLFKMKPVCV